MKTVKEIYPTVSEVLKSVTEDFESAWDAIASLPGKRFRGNYMFGYQAMILLEVACRVLNSDKYKLNIFSQVLYEIEPRYFTQIAPVIASNHSRSFSATRGEFVLPFRQTVEESHLLGLIFDLLRNGTAHQYEQIVLKLRDGYFEIGLTGPKHLAYINKIASRRSKQHLRITMNNAEQAFLLLEISTDRLYLDLKEACKATGLMEEKRSLSCFSPLKRDLSSVTTLDLQRVLGSQM